MRAHSDATPCSSCGKPPLAAIRRSTGTSTSSASPAYSCARARTPLAFSGFSTSVPPARSEHAGTDVFRRGHHEHRRLRHAGDLLVAQIRVIADVVEDQQGRFTTRPSAGQRLARRLRRAVHDDPVVLPHLNGELGHQACLADPALTGDEHEPAGAGERVLPVPAQPLQLDLSPHQRRRRGELGRQPDRVDRLGRLEPRILPQDRLMQLPQLGAGLHADRLHESRARVPIGRQRFRLPARAIQREHLLRPQSLAQRLIGDQRPELAEHLAVATRDQVGLDRQLSRL